MHEIARMTPRLLLLLLLAGLAVLPGCSREPSPRQSMEAVSAPRTAQAFRSDSVAAQKARNPYLAFEHYYRIELPEKLIRPRLEATVERCNGEDFFNCTLLESSLNEDDNYVSGTIRLRIQTKGVDPLVATAAEGGDIASQSSRAEDLTESVMDTEKRLEMLQSYRERLQALEKTAASDIESLIKVTSELARVQSEIEDLQGDRAQIQKRLDLDLLTIQLFADNADDFLHPISRALDRFLYTLSAGVSSIITTLAWILPWLVLVVIVFGIIRWGWRRKRR